MSAHNDIGGGQHGGSPEPSREQLEAILKEQQEKMTPILNVIDAANLNLLEIASLVANLSARVYQVMLGRSKGERIGAEMEFAHWLFTVQSAIMTNIVPVMKSIAVKKPKEG